MADTHSPLLMDVAALCRDEGVTYLEHELATYNGHRKASIASNFQIEYRLRSVEEVNDNDSLLPACLWRNHDKDAARFLFLVKIFHRGILSCCQLLQVLSASVVSLSCAPCSLFIKYNLSSFLNLVL